MFNLIITTIEWIVVLVVLAAFLIGAWRQLVADTLRDPLLVDSSPNSKAKGYLRFAGKVLWHILVPVAMVGGILLKFICLVAASKDDEETIVNNGSIWERDVTGVWYSFGADEDSTRPPQF